MTLKRVEKNEQQQTGLPTMVKVFSDDTQMEFALQTNVPKLHSKNENLPPLTTSELIHSYITFIYPQIYSVAVKANISEKEENKDFVTVIIILK